MLNRKNLVSRHRTAVRQIKLNIEMNPTSTSIHRTK